MDDASNPTSANHTQMTLGVGGETSNVDQHQHQNHPVSPLEPLDPHRLRDMVVDKQGSGSHVGSLLSSWSPQSTQIGVSESPNQTQIYSSTLSGTSHSSQDSGRQEEKVSSYTQSRLATPHGTQIIPGQNSPRTTPLPLAQSPFVAPPRVTSIASTVASPFPMPSTPAQQQFMQQFTPSVHTTVQPRTSQILSSPMTSPGPSPSPQTTFMMSPTGVMSHHSTQRVLPAYPGGVQMSPHYPYLAGGGAGPPSSSQWIAQSMPPGYVVSTQQPHQRLMGLQPHRMPMALVRGAAYSVMQSSNPAAQVMYLPPPQQQSQQASPVNHAQTRRTPQQSPGYLQLQSGPIGGAGNSSAIVVDTHSSTTNPPQPSDSTYGVTYAMQQQRFVQQHQMAPHQVYPQQQRGQISTLLSGYNAIASMPTMAPGLASSVQAMQIQSGFVSHVDGFAQPQMVRYTATNGESNSQSLSLSSLQSLSHTQHAASSASSPYHSQLTPQPTTGHSQTHPQHSALSTGPAAPMRSPMIVSPVPATAPPTGATAVVPVPVPVAVPVALFQHHSHSQNVYQQIQLQQQIGIQQPPMTARQVANSVTSISSNFQRVQYCGVELHGNAKTVLAADRAEICLAGCVFFLVEDYPATHVDFEALANLIRFYGGEVETQTARGIPDRVTHIICSTIGHNDFAIQQALNEKRKRFITYQWISETIQNKCVTPPSKAGHLPTCWSEQARPLYGKIVSLVGFDISDTINIKLMLSAVGAQVELAFNECCHILIAQSARCSEVEKARELSRKKSADSAFGDVLMPPYIVGYSWLVDLYFGNTRALTEIEREEYAVPALPPLLPSVPTTIASQHVIQQTPFILERHSEFPQKLLVPWRTPIIINMEHIERARELKQSIENDISLKPHLQYKCEDEAPTDSQIYEVRKIYRASMIVKGKNPDATSNVRVFFDGFLKSQVENLSRKVRFLGGEVMTKVADSTHLIVPDLSRRVRLLEAMARGLNIVTPKWINFSFSMLRFFDAIDFFVEDKKNEQKWGFNLRDTIYYARLRPVFKDITIHLSPSVMPSYQELCCLVEAAGGHVDKKRPKVSYLIDCQAKGKVYIVVVNENDLASYQYLITNNYSIFTEEYVIMMILRRRNEGAKYRTMIPLALQKIAIATKAVANAVGTSNIPQTQATSTSQNPHEQITSNREGRSTPSTTCDRFEQENVTLQTNHLVTFTSSKDDTASQNQISTSEYTTPMDQSSGQTTPLGQMTPRVMFDQNQINFSQPKT